MRHQFLILKLVKTEAVAVLIIVVVVLNICDNARCNLKLNILGCRILLLILIHRLKVLSDDGAVWNDIG